MALSPPARRADLEVCPFRSPKVVKRAIILLLVGYYESRVKVKVPGFNDTI